MEVVWSTLYYRLSKNEKCAELYVVNSVIFQIFQ
jgi:hypothetical protein